MIVFKYVFSNLILSPDVSLCILLQQLIRF